VNLFLEVLGKRSDGYHEIATLMVAVDLEDRLTFTEDEPGPCRLFCDQPELSTGPDNLVRRAADLLQRQTGCQRGALIELTKQIPLEAGLAGGSSDAAATLIGLNALWQLGVPTATLAEWSTQLGSDVAFFFAGPAAWCTGRGERVERLAMGRPLHFVLACPEFGLATADVYRGVTVPVEPLAGTEVRQALTAGDVDRLGQVLHNRLQTVALRLRPELATLAAQLAEEKPAGVLMSGSGSCMFALCRSLEEAVRVAGAVNRAAEAGARRGVFIVSSI
jgi:4-diphosphocytidyl-2-C-methyl-D-erythritol kinase